MEAGALNPAGVLPGLAGRSPLLRLQTDERLIALIRRGQHGAFEALVQRYQARLLSFCRHMLGSTEDAEDVLQEVFAAAFNAICADERAINARPWLYRIARNRCLNHLRRPVPNGQDSMDIFERDGGQTTADAVHKREEFRQIVADVQQLPETQRTALLLREMDALSYEHIAEAMDTTVPSVKSLLVRARVSLAEAAEARLLTCAEVRVELGEVAEGLTKTTAPVRRHLKTCDRCRTFRRELKRTNRALAAMYPLGPMIVLKKLVIGKLGLGASATTGGSGAAGGAGLASGATAAGAAGSGAGGIVSAGIGAIATKAAAGVAAAAIVTAGAVEARQHDTPVRHNVSASAVASAAPVVISSTKQVSHASAAVTAASAHTGASANTHAKPDHAAQAKTHAKKQPHDATQAAATVAPAPAASTSTQQSPPPPASPATAPASSSQAVPVKPTGTERDGSTVTLGSGSTSGSGSQGGSTTSSSSSATSSQPASSSSTTAQSDGSTKPTH